MVGKRSLTKGLVGLLMGGLLLVGCQQGVGVPTEGDVKEALEGAGKIDIGITQIIEHPALDGAREGFIAGLASKGLREGEEITLDFQNAQGDMAIAKTIAEGFVAQRKDMILAIATPTAQMAFQSTREIPIVITAVTDPVGAGLVESLERSGTNVTGTTDNAPLEKHFEMIKEIMPEAKRVGILYNSSEANAENQVARAKKVAPELELEIITATVTSTNDVSQSLEFLLSRVDVIYTVKDNIVASAITLVANRSMEKGIPIIGAEPAHVKAGALITEGMDYFKLGFQTALMAVEVLEGRGPQEMGIETLHELDVYINQETMERLNISIPEKIKTNAIFVESGEIKND